MHLSVFDSYDLKQIINLRYKADASIIKELVAYYLYREFHIDSDVYALSKRSIVAYDSLVHRLLRAKCQNIGTHAVKHRLYKGLVILNQTDVIVHLFDEYSEGNLNELSIEDSRYLSMA